MDGEILVKATISDIPYKTIIDYRKKSFFTDEPEARGGQDFGPTPTELLASSLASCVAITLRMYVNRKKWQVDEIRVTVTLNKELDRTLFKVSIEVDGNLDQTSLDRLQQIAMACPVHKILKNPIEINTQLS